MPQSYPNSLNWDENTTQRRGRRAQSAEYAGKDWVMKTVYKMYGEYLANLRKPYPKEMVEEYRAKYGGQEGAEK
jgi:hypothetical protein